MSTTADQPRHFNFHTTEVLEMFNSFVCNVQAIDKLKVVFYVTWLWAWTGLYVTKIFECVFKTILTMPDSWLSVPATLCKTIETTQNKKIQILNAMTEGGEVTNKLKIFLRYYWEQSDSGSAFDVNGFSMDKLSEYLNCSLLFCSYIISSNDQPIEPATFLSNVRRVLIENENSTIFVSTINDRTDRQEVFLGHVNFDDEEVKQEDYIQDYLLDSDPVDNSDIQDYLLESDSNDNSDSLVTPMTASFST